MQASHSSKLCICNPVRWTVEELCGNRNEIHVNFDDDGTFALFQEPTIGWITPEADKLGSRATKIIFKYTNLGVQLHSYETHHPVTLTAIKVAINMTKILNAHIEPDVDYPCAQPLSQSGWNFPVIGGWISKESVRALMGTCEEIVGLNSDFAVGLECIEENGDYSRNSFEVGDLVIVKRTKGLSTIAKVMEIGLEHLKVVIQFDANGKIMSYKDVPKHLVRGHLSGSAPSQESSQKKRKKNIF